ncbi:hypothetical protein [Prevotella dentalis]|uniref:hypothetical protein n=1 Tax=Prevotella dentalis TaxID=52227 RepID=UPI00265AFAF4|nr:hypothetical protein [Prevotella dentalis]MCF2638223.1 hypothetical protein [Prevotella dentalis]
MRYIYLLLSLFFTLSVYSSPATDNDKWKVLNEKNETLQKKLKSCESVLNKLKDKQRYNELKVTTLLRAYDQQRIEIDRLHNVCRQLEETLSADRKSMNGKINATNTNVQSNQETLHSRTLWGGGLSLAFFVAIIVVAYKLGKRINSGTATIADVRKAQEALQAAQIKMQEESVKLDNQLLAIVQKQLDASVPSANKTTGEPDHSLVVKLADEIARIETNLSKMDKSVRGYKQLVQAKDRMINNVRANGYEIISLLGQEYNDGMQFQTRFVPDESLPEGKRIITGMIKMQVNYNGKMIQPAEIVVSQNI